MLIRIGFYCLLLGSLSLLSCRKNKDGEHVPPFKIERVKELGTLTNPAALVGRDGGQSILIAGKIIWLFGDSFFDRKSVDGAQFRSNTGAQSSMDHPFELTEPVDANGVSYQLIPFTAAEKHINDSLNNPNDRIALWPTGVVSVDGDTALIFYSKVYLKDPWQDFGVGIAKYRPDQAKATRNTNLLFNYPEPNFQTPLRFNGYVYLFGKLRNTYGGAIARAPEKNVENRSSYDFWNGSSWTKDINAAQSVISEPGGSFSYNNYLKRYVHVYNEFANNTVYIQVADHPEGPWSTKQTLYKTVAPDHDYNYLAIEHPELSKDNGKTIYISYHRPLSAFLAGETRLVQIDFQ